MWIGKDVAGSNLKYSVKWHRGWCHDTIWGDMWIWTDDIECFLDQIYIAMCIGKPVTSSYHDHFEVLYGL
jgi:hypothetical protein